MAWLRLDDGFADHPKLVHLGKPEHRWTWLEILIYCARHRTAGNVPPSIHDVIRRATPAFLKRCVDVGLLDRASDGSLTVHDWEDYNPKDALNAERQRRFRERHRNDESNADRNASRNGEDDAEEGEDRLEERYGKRHGNGPSRAAARARPVPSPEEVSTAAAVVHPAAAADLDRLKAAGWTKRQLDDARADLDRALALLSEAEDDPAVDSPGALAWTKFQSGAEPEADRAPTVAPGATGTRSTSKPLKSTTEPLPERTPPPVDLRTLGTTPPDDDDPEPA